MRSMFLRLASVLALVVAAVLIVVVMRESRIANPPRFDAGEDLKRTADRVASKTREDIEQSTSALERAAEKAGDKTKEGVTQAGREVTDAWILTLVKSHFFGEKALKGSDINVDVDRHVVTLKGTVSSQAGRARAVEIASNTEGVTKVVDRLSVSAGN